MNEVTTVFTLTFVKRPCLRNAPLYSIVLKKAKHSSRDVASSHKNGLVD